jgi:hypothetical protein
MGKGGGGVLSRKKKVGPLTVDSTDEAEGDDEV